jgi:hypothetical protein
MTKYSFRKYCNLIGFIEIEADSDKEAIEKYERQRYRIISGRVIQ